MDSSCESKQPLVILAATTTTPPPSPADWASRYLSCSNSPHSYRIGQSPSEAWPKSTCLVVGVLHAHRGRQLASSQTSPVLKLSLGKTRQGTVGTSQLQMPLCVLLFLLLLCCCLFCDSWTTSCCAVLRQVCLEIECYIPHVVRFSRGLLVCSAGCESVVTARWMCGSSSQLVSEEDRCRRGIKSERTASCSSGGRYAELMQRAESDRKARAVTTGGGKEEGKVASWEEWDRKDGMGWDR